MILQALARLYDRLAAQPDSGLAPYGYSPEKISYAIVLRPDGSVADVQDLRVARGKTLKPQEIIVPQGEKSASAIRAKFLWDKTAYLLGVGIKSKRADKEHEAFKALHLSLLADATDEGLLALKRFLQQWRPEQFQPPLFTEEMKDTNMVFSLAGENTYLHERPAAQALRMGLLQAQEPSEDGGDSAAALATCLVTGVTGPVARLHPAIKGVYGAQSSGASIVSFNQDAFNSFGKEQGDNAPVSAQAAFAYTTALNHLLRSGAGNRQRIQIGDTSVVFWAEAPDPAQAGAAENLLATLLNPDDVREADAAQADATQNLLATLFEPSDDTSEAQKVRHVLQAVQQARPLNDAQLDAGLHPDTRIYVLGLAPNAARLSVRLWLVDSLQHLVGKLAQHAQDLRIEPLPWQTAPALRRLVLATVPNREGAAPKADDAPPHLIGEMLRAVLTGGPYPLSLLSNTVMRIRADGNLSGLRAAICKGVLTRQQRLFQPTSQEEIPVSLDTQSTQPAYLMGRLFAALEHVQRSALGMQVNATIRDRYYGAASATPASIFPVLLRNTQNHMTKLRKERPGQAVHLEKLLGDIVDGLPQQFPRSLNIENQGRFAIGYYHQNRALFTKSGGASDEASTQPNNMQQENF